MSEDWIVRLLRFLTASSLSIGIAFLAKGDIGFWCTFCLSFGIVSLMAWYEEVR